MTQNFPFHIYTLQKLPGFYESITYGNEGDSFSLLHESELGEPKLNSSFEVFEDVPGYLNVRIKKLPRKIGSKSIKQYPGFRIDFKGIKNLDEYLRSRFGRSSRYKLRRAVKKLEGCFDISYRMYFGEMDRDEYDFIFESFYDLLEVRSLEKGIKNNRNFKTKETYYKLVYPLILERKASFFVIFNKEEPIDICLNFHLDKILFQFIRTYDIAYSKFNTGYIDLMKQIEWCIENGVRSISFSKGDFYWKRRWCNEVYDYDFHIFYKKTSIVSQFQSHFYIFKRNIRQYLRDNGTIEKYHVVRDRYLRKALVPNITDSVITMEIPELKPKEIGAPVDLSRTENLLLKRVIFEYLFATDEKEADIAVYEDKHSRNTYLIRGLHSNMSIRLK